MSEDVNQDIQNAINEAQRIGSSNSSNDSVNIPQPNVLLHGLDRDGVIIPEPRYRQDSKNK